MSNFLSSIRNLENAVEAKREADKQAKQAAELATQNAIIAEQVENSLCAIELMGIEASADQLRGESKHILMLDAWKLTFGTSSGRVSDSNFYKTSIIVRFIDADGSQVGEKQAVARRVYWSVTFENVAYTLSDDDRELIRIARNVGLNADSPYNSRDSFIMKLYADSKNPTENAFDMPEALKLEMAGNILDIEKKYKAVSETLPEWRTSMQERIAGARARIAQEEKEREERQLAWQAEEDKRHQEWLARQESMAKEESEIAAKARYTFSGDSLGEILEQVTREIVAQEQSEEY